MATFVLSNGSNQHASVLYRTVASNERYLEAIIPFGGVTEIVVPDAEKGNVFEQIDAQCRSMRIECREK